MSQWKPPRRRPSTRTTVIGGAVVAFLVVVLLVSAGPGPALGILGLIALVTALYAVVSGRASWARIPSRKAGAIVLAAAIVVFGVGVGIEPSTSDTPSEAAGTATTAPDHSAPATSAATVEPAAVGEAAPVTADPAVYETSALSLLATLPVKGRAPMTGYDRVGDFGEAWTDVDGNGCDTRDDILARDLTDAAIDEDCTVESGTLVSPYTARTIAFTRGEGTSTAVQIDHLVALGDAWQTGAQQLTQAQRVSLANDPVNLLAVDGASNEQKSDSDAASWLPKSKAFRCVYVSRQVTVKAEYGLWVTPAEHDSIEKILLSCPELDAPVSPFVSTTTSSDADQAVTEAVAVGVTDAKHAAHVAAVKKKAAAAAKVAAAKKAAAARKAAADAAAKAAADKAAADQAAAAAAAPAAPAYAYYANCTDVRAHNAAPIHRGDPGYSSKLDRDGDGVGCE